MFSAINICHACELLMKNENSVIHPPLKSILHLTGLDCIVQGSPPSQSNDNRPESAKQGFVPKTQPRDSRRRHSESRDLSDENGTSRESPARKRSNGIGL